MERTKTVDDLRSELVGIVTQEIPHSPHLVKRLISRILPLLKEAEKIGQESGEEQTKESVSDWYTPRPLGY